jgi:hypothetical protein
MRNIVLALALLVPTAALAQSGHSVVLTVTSPDTSVVAPGTATILRAAGACPASGVPASGTTLTSTLAVPATATFTDSTVTGGNTYCFWTTLKTAGGGSGVSNTFQGATTVVVTLSGTVQ